MNVVRSLQAVRITAELAAVAAVTMWGFQITSRPVRWALALSCAAAFLLIWGRYVAPKSPHRLDDPARLLTEIVLFVAAGAAAGAATAPAVGLGLGVLAVLDALALRAVDPTIGSTRESQRHTIQERP